MKRNALLKLESRYQTELRTYLQAKGWWVRKLHGNVYQAGLPDLLVLRPRDSRLMFIEMKAVDEKTQYTVLDLIEKLEGPQAGSIIMLAKQKAPVHIIAGCPRGSLLASSPFPPRQKIYPLRIDEIYDDLNSH